MSVPQIDETFHFTFAQRDPVNGFALSYCIEHDEGVDIISFLRDDDFAAFMRVLTKIAKITSSEMKYDGETIFVYGLEQNLCRFLKIFWAQLDSRNSQDMQIWQVMLTSNGGVMWFIGDRAHEQKWLDTYCTREHA